MNIMHELRDMAIKLASLVPIPPIKGIVFPTYYENGQPAESEFMVMALEGGAAGISFVMIPVDYAETYRALEPEQFIGTKSEEHAAMFGCNDPVKNMIALAAINSICQHVMRTGRGSLDLATDSIGLMSIQKGDRVGMVGYFRPLLKYIERVDAELIVIEKNKALLNKVQNFHITGDITELKSCNKVLCTSTTVLNNTLEEVLSQCSEADHVAVLGPTAGFYPDPLFERGVDVVGSRYVHDGEILLSRIKNGERWGDATQKLCFQKSKYKSIFLQSN